MSEYVRVHYKKIQSGDEDRQKKVKTWKTFMQKLKKQVKLFMVSCVQIASKMCSHYKVTSHSNKTTLVHKSLFVCLFVCLYVSFPQTIVLLMDAGPLREQFPYR